MSITIPRRIALLFVGLIAAAATLTGAPAQAHHSPGHGGGPGGGGGEPPAPIDVGWIYSHGDMDWSPDQDPGAAGLQSTIVFNGRENAGKREQGLWTVSPSGAGLTLMIKGRDARSNKQTNLWLNTPFWSPAGTHIAYMETESFSLTNSVQTIRRMAADGSGNAALASDGASQDLRRLLEWTNVD